VVPDITAEQLREHLERDMPGVVAPPRSADQHEGADEQAQGKGGHGKADLLATSDTIVVAEHLANVVTYIRNQLGYTYLSDIAAVDYLDDDVFELVYTFYHLEGGGRLVVKVRVPRDQPDVPALTPIWPGANLHEREAFDLFGINFIGHPYLKRIYMWDELDGHPMRKDFPKQGDKYLGDGG
jgi:NADH-quinone oxidoreductase subunit C